MAKREKNVVMRGLQFEFRGQFATVRRGRGGITCSAIGCGSGNRGNKWGEDILQENRR